MKKEKHSELPFSSDDGYIFDKHQNEIAYLVNEAEIDDTAELFVTACNNFYPLLEALEEFVRAEEMETYPIIEFTFPERKHESSYGGGDCSKHGRYYGTCCSCRGDYESARKNAEMEARYQRNTKLRDATIKAKQALAQAKGEK